jgi:hypothetical protein
MLVAGVRPKASLYAVSRLALATWVTASLA